MLFSFGPLELAALVVIAVPLTRLYVRRDSRYRYGIAALVCATAAAAVTPADLPSMLLMFAGFMAAFAFGARYRLEPPRTAG